MTAALLRARERVPHCAVAAVIDLADGAILAATPEPPTGTATAALAVRDLLRHPPDTAGDGPTAEVIVAVGPQLLVGLRSRHQPGLGLLLVCGAGTVLGQALVFARTCLGEVEQEI